MLELLDAAVETAHLLLERLDLGRRRAALLGERGRRRQGGGGDRPRKDQSAQGKAPERRKGGMQEDRQALPRRDRRGAPRPARPPGAVTQAPAHQLIGPPAMTVTERRFCDQQLSFEHRASGRSLP